MNNQIESFETLLAENIIKSLTDNPELWQLSIMGLKRSPGNALEELELSISIIRAIYVYKPHEYRFTNKNIEEKLYDVAEKLWHQKYENAQELKEKQNRDKLAEYLKLDSRLNKLKHLEQIAEPEPEQTKKEEYKEIELKLPKKRNFFQKIYDFF